MSSKKNHKRIVVLLALVFTFVATTAESCDSNNNGANDMVDTGRKIEAQVLDAVGGCTGVMQVVCAPNK